MTLGALNPGFAFAALAAFATFCVHTFIGGRFAARPLLADTSLSAATKWLNYMTWHMVTALLVLMVVALGWASTGAEGAAQVVVVMVVLSALLSATTVFVTNKAGIAPWRFPSSYLFLIILACGLWGLSAQS